MRLAYTLSAAALAAVLVIAAYGSVNRAYAVNPGPSQDLRIVNGELLLSHLALVQAGQTNPGPVQNQLIQAAQSLTSDAKSRLTDWVTVDPGPIQDPAVRQQLQNTMTISNQIVSDASGLLVGVDPGPVNDQLNQIIANAQATSSLANGKLQCDPAVASC